MSALRWLVASSCAVALATAAWLKIWRPEVRIRFDRSVTRLRQARRLPRMLADPVVHARVVGRLEPILPSWGMGCCMKRSLLPVHLWSRCGLDPQLHLGVRAGHRGHAWVTKSRLATAPQEPAAEVVVL
ncbi:MAG: lasso peptide biosynthesis protein [Acidobacteriia bacterium]|nr:lasso peptide biosynthesis protein [Terriglobia bacterium]